MSSLRQSCAPRRCRASACSSSRTCRSARIDRRRGMAGGTGLREPQCAHILPPVCGVSAYAETIPRDTARLEERIARLLQSIGWSGIFQVQFIRSGDRHYLIDLNPGSSDRWHFRSLPG